MAAIAAEAELKTAMHFVACPAFLVQLWYLEPFLVLEIRFTQNIDLAEP